MRKRIYLLLSLIATLWVCGCHSSLYQNHTQLNFLETHQGQFSGSLSIFNQDSAVQTLPMRFKIENSPNKNIRENPNAFDINGYVTTRPIKAGAQIFVDYGYNYWRNKTPNFTHATADDIAEAFSELD